MTQYVVGHLTALKDKETLTKYKHAAVEALAKHGGKIVVPVTPPVRVEGDAEGPKGVALLSFPDAPTARAWFEDPELQDVHDQRRAGADMSFFLIEPPV